MLSLASEYVQQRIQLLSLRYVCGCCREYYKSFVESWLVTIEEMLDPVLYWICCRRRIDWRPWFSRHFEAKLVLVFKRAKQLVESFNLFPRGRWWYRYRGGRSRTTTTIAVWTIQAGWLLHDHKAMQAFRGLPISSRDQNSNANGCKRVVTETALQTQIWCLRQLLLVTAGTQGPIFKRVFLHA